MSPNGCYTWLILIMIYGINVDAASCAGVTCSAGKSCIVDQLGLPHCLRCDVLDYCPWDSADRSPICGADGRTYAGQCRLLEAACSLGRSVRLAYRGRCQGQLATVFC